MAGRNFLFKRSSWDFAPENRDHILLQFYIQEGQEIPQEIIVPENAGFTESILQNWFDGQKPKANVIIPQKGTKKLLVMMAEKNAHSYLMRNVPPNAIKDLEDLQKVLNLPCLPNTIEAFDISNLGESFTAAGMVQFKNGLPNKSAYRRYKIKSVEGQNDFAMMMEVVERRLKRLEDEGAPFPDLLLIDGGKGQLNAAIEVLKNFKNPPLIASLAEKEETLFSPCIDEPLTLPPAHPARKLVVRIRDEVHRYALGYHRKIRGKQFSRSVLENLPGIGKAKAKLLLIHFGSLNKLSSASVEEIAQVKGFSEESAAKLRDALHSV